MSNLYTTKTAALKATKADVSKLNVKNIKVNGKDVATSVKHPNDTREVITENDLWGSWAEIKDGEIIFHDDEIVNPPNKVWNINIAKVENNKAYTGEIDFYGALSNLAFCANVQTEKIKGGYNMFSNCANLTTFASDLSSLIEGCDMFHNCSNLTTFTSDMSSLIDGPHMFSSCSKLTNFTSDLSSLTNGYNMFHNCSKLTNFTSDLSSLTDSYGMFYKCTNLTSFDSDLSSLTNGDSMFYYCHKLTTFTSDSSGSPVNLSSLTNGDSMFYYCANLASFTSDLSSLTNGREMFYRCDNLTTFASDLSSLTNGYHMFYECKLDTDSLIHIAETIKDVRDLTNGSSSTAEIYKTIHIDIDNTTPTEEETELLTEIHNKGWQVYVNGTSNSNIFNPTNTTSLDGEESVTVIPFYAKPVESDEEHAEYTDGNGKFYNILGGQFIFVDDPDTYGMFTSLEDAVTNMRLTKIEKTTNKN